MIIKEINEISNREKSMKQNWLLKRSIKLIDFYPD